MPPWAKQRPILNRITSPGRGAVDLARAGEQEAEIALLVAVQHPVAGVGPRVERLDEAEVAIDADQQHRAVDADALDVGRVMIGRADPGARRRDDGGALPPFPVGGRAGDEGLPEAIAKRSSVRTLAG